MDKKTKNENLRIRLTTAEKATIERAAAKVGLPTTTWLRQLILRHIKEGLLVLAALLFSGCASYVELHNTTDRIWVMEKDGRTLLRCYDMVPLGPMHTSPQVFCKEAWMYGVMTDPKVVAPPAERQLPMSETGAPAVQK